MPLVLLLRRLALLEHLEHAVGDDEAADDVRRREHDRDEADDPHERALVGLPSTIIAPTITIPWIAFVPDISGVCSIVGTFEITSKPRKIASTRIVSSKTSSVLWLMRRLLPR